MNHPTDPTAVAAPMGMMRPVARGVGYVPTVGPGLRLVLAVIFAGVAFLGATGAYLAAITLMNDLETDPSKTYVTPFSFWMLLAHTGIGVLFLIPFFFFGTAHFLTARKRPNRAAVRRGLIVFGSGILVGLTGIALVQLDGYPQLPTHSTSHIIVYTMHVVLPVLAIVFYIAHRRSGPAVRWNWGYAWGGSTVGFVLLMVVLHKMDPRDLYVEGPKEGEMYFHPSESRTASGNFIPAKTLMMDQYCMRCHSDIYKDHLHSAHKFSSFNNPPYLFSVRETRKVSLERDGNVKAARWCAGCHDPVPFFSGAFDDPKFDDVNHPTSQAGITCTVCHSMTKIHGTTGNGNYTIEEPQHYPFAFSDNKSLQWINNQLVKAKPDFHKKTFLKPFHKTAEFCATCHKVSLPVELNHYKDFLRGQNHYDTYLLSGVSGHGVRSFYYPPIAKENCAECHMPLKESQDFGRKDFDGSGVRKVHNHFFPGGNTGLPFLLALDPKHSASADEFRKAEKISADFLRGTDPEGKDKKLRIDIFGLKKDGSTKPETLIAPLRPNLPALKPGQTYLVEIVVRTLNLGHPFSQGTVDSNEIWVDFKAETGGKMIGRNGALQDEVKQSGPVDEWSHFINVLMLDRKGNRINRRNPQDIFTPLYDHQIPPGAASVLHYRLEVPADAKESVKLQTRLRYRKFDYEYMKLVHDGKEPPILPIVDMCADEVILPIEGGSAVAEQTSKIPPWQRWNDYGIGCLLEGPAGAKKGHYKQAEAAFRKVTELGVKDATAHGYVNLARGYIDEGRLNEAAKALASAAQADPPAPWWTLTWFNSLVTSENATSKEDIDTVIHDLSRLVNPDNQPNERKFDFTKDYVVLDLLANRLLRRSQFEPSSSEVARQFVLRAVTQSEKVLALDSEDVQAHDLLRQCYAVLGDSFNQSSPQKSRASNEELTNLGKTLADGKQSREARIAAAAQLIWEIDALSNVPAEPNQPRLPVFRNLLGKLRTAYHEEKDAELAAAIARSLSVIHRESHARYKPDENARAYTTGEYRKTHKPADYAARDRVIYPTTAEQRKRIIDTGGIEGKE